MVELELKRKMEDEENGYLNITSELKWNKTLNWLKWKMEDLQVDRDLLGNGIKWLNETEYKMKTYIDQNPHLM